MATKPEDDDQDDTLELTEELKPSPDDDQDDGADDTGDDQDDGEGPALVTFGDEDPDDLGQVDNSAIRRMREQLRDKERRIRELEQSSAPKPVEVGPKPGLWDDDIAGDEELYDKRLLAWKAREDAAGRQQETQAEESRKLNEAWQQDLSAFEQKKGRLQFEDRDDAISTATASFDLVQQAVIVKAAADPALLLYALSKSEAKRDELAKIHDPIKMAAAVARMEGAVKVTKGRKAPEPDKPQRGSSAMPGGSDKQLEKLEKEAARTSDRTKLIAYKTKLSERDKGK